jgi:RES domain-containing protein
LKEITPRLFSGVVWRQTRPRNDLLDFKDPAPYASRYNRAQGPGTWYASFTERGAWAELFRHYDGEGISPFELRRRVGRVRVTNLKVLDLSDPSVRTHLQVTLAELVDDDWSLCQDLADRARQADFEGLIVPSAALEGEISLVLFTSGMTRVVAEHSRIQRPPVRMLKVILDIRIRGENATTIGRLYEALHKVARRLGRR